MAVISSQQRAGQVSEAKLRSKFQGLVFLVIWPGANILLLGAILLDLGVLGTQLFIPAAIRIWFLFSFAFLAIKLIDKTFPQIYVQRGFLLRFFFHAGLIMLSASIFSPIVEIPESVLSKKVEIVPLTLFLLQVSVYLTVLNTLEQKERLYKTELVLNRSELNVLRAQSNPHFLFNTLNLLISEISSDPRNAKEIVYDLADLLRSTVKIAQQTFTTVSHELKLAELYLKLQQKRFKDRLSYEIILADSQKDFQIPVLILQPVVENSIKHAVAPFTLSAKITITVNSTPKQLTITVADTAPPFDDANITEGEGFRIIRKTLELHYPGRYSINLESTEKGGVFTLQLPAVDTSH